MFFFKKSALFIALSLCALLSPTFAQQGISAQKVQAEWTLYLGQGVDANLTNLPKKIATDKLKRESSFLTGIGYAIPTRSPDWLAGLAGVVGIDQPSTAVELLGVQHRGLQSNFEADVGYLLRTGYASLGPLQIRAGVGTGLSYAFGTPSYEDGPFNNPAKRYKFQSFEAFEVELRLADAPSVGLVTRVHHRSGMYGLIAPKNVGSNFLTIGLRSRF